MSTLPDSNGGEARAWMSRARIQQDLANLAADRQYWHEGCHHLVRAAELAIKAAFIASCTPVPRQHHIGDLLADCPTKALRERIEASFNWSDLEQFSTYYLSVYPDGEDADQSAYAWCSQITQKVMRCVEEILE